MYALTRPPKHERSLRGWLARVARNVTINMKLEERRRAEREARTALREADVAESVHALQSEDLRRAIRKLPARYAEVLELRYFEGLSTRQIAQLWDLPLGTVRTRQRRALLQLRHALEPRWRRGDSIRVFLMGVLRGSPEQLRAPGSLSILSTTMVVAMALWATLAAGGSRFPLANSIRPTVGGAAVGLLTQGTEIQPTGDVLRQEGSVRIRGHWEDGRPAQGVGVYLESPLPRSSAREAVLDAEGMVEWSELAPGKWKLASTAGVTRVITVRPGDVTLVQLALGRPRRLTGRALPVAGSGEGCSVYLSLPDDVDRLIRVGEAGVGGWFSLSHFVPGSWVTAGWGPSRMSALVSLDHPSFLGSDPPELELRLLKSRKPLSVTVQDPEGRPVPGARVRFSGAARFPAPRGMDGLRRIDPVIEALTDRSGVCTVVSRTFGSLELEVASGEFAPWRGLIREGVLDVTARLARPARLVGTVRSPAGEPLAGARVTWHDSVGGGSTSSDENGRYRTGRLAEGSCRVDVVRGEGRSAFAASAGWELRPGELREWSPRLEPTGWLQGRALDQDGRPMTGCWVALFDTSIEESIEVGEADLEHEPSVRWSAVGGDGVFCFAELPGPTSPKERSLRLFRTRAGNGPAIGWLDDVPHGAGDLVLGPWVTGPGDASLRVRPAAGHALSPDAALWLTSAHTPSPVHGVRMGQVWSFAGLTAGSWSVVLWERGCAPSRRGEVALSPGDCAVFEIEPAPPWGSLDVTVVDAAGLLLVPRLAELISLEDPSVRTQSARHRGSRLLSIQSDGRIVASVPAGDYLLIVRDSNEAIESRRVTVESGESSRIELPLVARARRKLMLELPLGRRDRGRQLWLEFRTVAGERVHERFWSIQSRVTQCTLSVPLPEEELRVLARVTSRGALLGETSANLPALSSDPRRADEVFRIRVSGQD